MAEKVAACAKHLDVTMIKATLRMTPEERLQAASNGANGMQIRQEAYQQSKNKR